MPYAIRNENGEIVALTASPNKEDDQLIGFENPEVLRFLSGGTGNSDYQKYNELLIHDLQQIRILEDLIDLLIAKRVFLFSELPAKAQEKLLKKKTKRKELDHNSDILVNNDSIF